MNPRRIVGIAFKEILQVRRDPRGLAIALLMPLTRMVLPDHGVSLDIRRVPRRVHDQKNSLVGRELMRRFVASHWFTRVHTLPDERAPRDAVDHGARVGAATIPVNFTGVLASTGNADR